jgi:hypothetical protein
MINACDARVVDDIGVMIGVEYLGDSTYQLELALAHGTPINTGPGIPGQPSGELNPIIDTSYDYVAIAADPESDALYYQWIWEEGDTSGWLGPHSAGEPCTTTHSWPRSPVLTVSPTCCIGIRGDVNGSGGTANVADLTYLVDFLFRGGPPPPCTAEGDVNGSGGMGNVADLTYLVDFLFRGGPPSPSCL